MMPSLLVCYLASSDFRLVSPYSESRDHQVHGRTKAILADGAESQAGLFGSRQFATDRIRDFC